MAKTKSRRRPLVRRVGESAYGLLLVGRQAVMAGVALLLVVAGVWTSWQTAQHSMLTKGRERGTMTVERCDGDVCRGPFVPSGVTGAERPSVSIGRAVTTEEGERLAVAVKPGSGEVVRAGVAGVLYAWVPFAGSLLLASLVVAGGLRMRRTAWALAAVGALLLGGAFFTL